MRTLVWIAVGLAIVVLSWVPLNMADPRDIPFGAAILGFVGSIVGGVIALVAGIRWIRCDAGSGRAGR